MADWNVDGWGFYAALGKKGRKAYWLHWKVFALGIGLVVLNDWLAGPEFLSWIGVGLAFPGALVAWFWRLLQVDVRW